MSDAKDKLDELKERLDELKERLEQLERFENALHEALYHIQDAESDCPEEIIFSHHAEMEIYGNICDVQDLREKLEQQIEAIE